MTSVSCTVDIDRPVDVVYDAWTHSPRIRTFLGGTAERRIDLSFRAAGQDRSQVAIELNWEPADGTGLTDQLVLRRQLQAELDGLSHNLAARDNGHGPAGRPPAGEWAPASEPAPVTGDGRGAGSPIQIPPRGWLEILKRTGKQVQADNVSIVSGGVAFYVFVALVPTLIAVISMYGLVANPVDVGRQLGPFFSALPEDAAQLVENQVKAITDQPQASLGFGLVIGVVVALVGASKGMLALVSALNIAFDEPETRTFLRLRGLALALTLGLAVAAAAGIGGMVVVRNLATELGSFGETAVAVLRWPVLAMLVVLALAALYRYAPDRAVPKWRWVTPGAVLATVLWLVGSIAFSIYVRNFGTYNETYGALGAVVVLLLWLLLSAYAIVLGAEFDAETERQPKRDSTRGPSQQPLGQRGDYASGPPPKTTVTSV